MIRLSAVFERPDYVTNFVVDLSLIVWNVRYPFMFTGVKFGKDCWFQCQSGEKILISYITFYTFYIYSHT